MNVLPLGSRCAASGISTCFSQTTSPLALRSVTRLPLCSADEDVVVRQQLGVEREVELADIQARMVGAVELQDAALVEQDDEGVADGAGGVCQAVGVHLGAVVVPPRLPGVAVLAAGGRVQAAEGGGALSSATRYSSSSTRLASRRGSWSSRSISAGTAALSRAAARAMPAR